MITLLSAIGRITVIVTALLTIAGFTVAGYGLAGGGYGYVTQEHYGGFWLGAVHGAGGVWGAVLGFIVGIVVAGAVFGPIATLYDIRDNIRRAAG